MFAAVLVAALTSGPKGIPALSLGATDAQVVVATKELSAGHVLTESDLKLDDAQLGDLGAGSITRKHTIITFNISSRKSRSRLFVR